MDQGGYMDEFEERSWPWRLNRYGGGIETKCLAYYFVAYIDQGCYSQWGYGQGAYMEWPRRLKMSGEGIGEININGYINAYNDQWG